MPWRRKWQHTPVFLPGRFYGQRSLKGCIVHGVTKRHNWVTEHTRIVNLQCFLVSDVQQSDSIHIYTYICINSFSDSFPLCGTRAQSCPILCTPFGLSPARFLCPWGFSGKDTGVGCQSLLQGLFLTLGLNPSPASPSLQADSLPAEPSGEVFHYKFLKYID